MSAVALAEVDWILDIWNPFLILYSAVSDRGYNVFPILHPLFSLLKFPAPLVDLLLLGNWGPVGLGNA